jgi:chromosome segregation ATPase
MAQTLLAQVLNRATAYTALTDKLAPLEPIVPDERTRYQAAYALIKGSRTLEQVVQAIDLQHLAALDAEVARFTAQLKDTEQREIEHRGDEVKTLNTRIDALHEQIRVAEEALQAERDRVADVTRQIDAKRQEIAAVQAQFDTATQQVKTLLEQAKAKVLRHLT